MQYFTTFRTVAAYILLCAAALFYTTESVAQSRPDLGTASTYAIFTGGGAINNTGLTHLVGDVGQDGAYAFNGFPPGTYTGTLNRNNSASALAKGDLLTAQTTEAAVPCDFVLGIGIVDGQSFDPGVYCSGAATTTSGNITFNAHGNGNAIFIVKIGGALSANSGTHILLANNARAANIYWFVDGAVSVADNSSFKGTIIANGAIIFAGTSSLDGRALAAPAGAITLSANNMAVSTDTGAVNNLTVVRPALGDFVRGGTLNDTIRWMGTGIAPLKTLEYSLDSGITWATIATITSSALEYVWHVPDTASAKAFVRVTDANNLRGVSGRFTIGSSKIVVIHPSLAESVSGGTMNYQITWSGTGLTSRKIFEYSLDSGLTWKTIDTMRGGGFTHSWNIPDTVSTHAMVRITDSLGITGTSGVFTINSSKIVVIRPALGEIIAGGTQHYQITWTGTGLAPQKTIALSLDSGLTWRTIATVTGNLFSSDWNVPDTASTRAMIRVTDGNGVTGKSGLFTILSSRIPAILVVRPAGGEVILGGTQNYQITFTGYGIAAQKKFEYSLDSGITWHTIGFMTSNAFSFTWATVPDTTSTRAFVRITDGNGLMGMSMLFTIRSSRSPSIIVLRPEPGEAIIKGTQGYAITWTGSGLTAQKTLELTLDGGLTWRTIGTVNADVFTYSWNVPDTVSTQGMIRITDGNGTTGTSGLFSIVSNSPVLGHIVVIHPVTGEAVDGGSQNFPITFTATNTTTQKTFEYSIDGGANWVLIGYMNSEALRYYWANVPNVATTMALVRITDANGVTGTSGLFTIKATPGVGSINSVTLSGLDSRRNIGNDRTLGISWTYTPQIGTSVDVEYSLDYMVTWNRIATVPVGESPDATTWTTVMTGYYNPVFIRVTSSLGMSRIAAAFSIGASAGVTPGEVQNGYSVSNYPNPANSQTSIHAILPVAANATLTIIDVLGREVGMVAQHLDAGGTDILLNTANLSAGRYVYVLQAGTVRVAGQMTIVR